MQKELCEYLDYREFLRDYFEHRKSLHPHYSLRTLSDKLGFKTKDFISRVMRGEKNLSAQSAQRVAHGLGFAGNEFLFFQKLVTFNQAESEAQRRLAFAQLQEVLQTIRFSTTQKLLAHYQYQVFSDWRHLAVRSLIGMHGFSGDYEGFSQLLHPRIQPDELRESVQLLMQCGLIEQLSDGHFQLTHNAITTGDRTSRQALRGFHQACLHLGAQSIDRDPPAERHISGLTLGISPQGYARIVDRLNAFRKEIAQIADEDNAADRVYQMDFVLFPLSRRK